MLHEFDTPTLLALKFVILSDLAVSVALTYIACLVIGGPFAHISLMKLRAAASRNLGLGHLHQGVFFSLAL
jgi:hypothetical protein